MPQVRTSVPGPKKMGEARRSLLLHRLPEPYQSFQKELQNLGKPRGAPQIPPLRYAPVGMTIQLGNYTERSQTKLSSRPERSGAEGSAVRPSAFPNSGVLTQTL